ncbi:hypothetical protein ZIOFF_020174 [Zingiber officinale]|uniref:Uncharacterized protein n=1 Tax=Zingiber officinale TaxID=94328 RepID=A0A8J5HF57_ZINOF|nr:hypothetical protein ZIOFF_020172 [Zingiber officinale]KAG6523017.1 hypothetical protein ZIOFF_020174 [Zingiber officinale]
MEDDRQLEVRRELWLNSPNTSAVTLEVLGHRLHLSQDPNSKHLGTTVWDASMVFVKFLDNLVSCVAVNVGYLLYIYKLTSWNQEKNCRKGRFCPSKLKGKRVIELGAGCGLAGLGMALLGCNVTSTDQTEVLPLLMRNAERNSCWITQANPDSGSASFGCITVAELDWGNEDHIRAVEPPFDFILGTDVVSSIDTVPCKIDSLMKHVELRLQFQFLPFPLNNFLSMLPIELPLVQTKDSYTGYEVRSTTVHDRMMDMWKENFIVKTIPKAKMDSKYQHPSIQLFMMEVKDQSRYRHTGVSQVPESSHRSDEDDQNHEADVHDQTTSEKIVKSESGKAVDDWEIRRLGSMAARLLRDVKIK